MKVIDIIRLIRRHVSLLTCIPLMLALFVMFLTRNPHYVYTSQTTLYTGLATGLTVEIDKTFNYAATSAAFDNLMNIIKSRETLQEVAIRLLSQHLMLEKPDPKYISSKAYAELKNITPSYIYNYIADDKTFNSADTVKSTSYLFPASINRMAYEQTVRNLSALMRNDDTNFVYKILNYTHPHYSISALSGIRVQRIFNSDLLKIDYQTDDPGICQQTLAIMNEVCIKNYKGIKENRSDAVVKYFENQLSLAKEKLDRAEDKLLAFNMQNNIINYYEQSKAVAGMKELLDAEVNTRKVEMAGLQASITRLEDKLASQQLIQLRSASVIEKKSRFGEISYRIAAAELRGIADAEGISELAALKLESEKIREEISGEVSELYKFGNSLEGLPLKDILSEWIIKVIEFEDARAGIKVMEENYTEFLKQYSIYAPAGANLKRIEREISVSESEFLEILHGLNLANLKLQDNELSSNIKAIDYPYYPLNPVPTKRKLLILAAAIVGFILIITGIFAMEYLDDTLRNPDKASGILKLPFLGVIPKILLRAGTVNMAFVQNRLLEFCIQKIELSLKNKTSQNPKTIVFLSSLKGEGKTVVAGNIAAKMISQGKKVLYLNYVHEDIHGKELPDSSEAMKMRSSDRLINAGLFISRLLGYPDSRTDRESPFLENPANYLAVENYNTFRINDNFSSVETYRQIPLNNAIDNRHNPDYVLIEIPPLLYYPFPADLLANADLLALVTRANRCWTEADQSLLNLIKKNGDNNIHFILNGAELPAVKTVIGELPKKRSFLRLTLKNFFRFQFFSRNRI